MASGDWVFWGIIVFSIVSSIVKALNKKPRDVADTGMPDFKGSKPGDTFKQVLRELMAEEDNYLPTNPKPSAPVQNKPAQPLKVEPLKRQETPAAFERIRNATENKPRREFVQEQLSPESEDVQDALLQTLDISQPDELKKAIIYSEILRPKF